MAEIRINATGGVKLYDADDSHYAQIVAGTITSNVDAITLGHNIATFNAAVTAGGVLKTDDTTEATSTTDGSLQTDGGLSVAKDTVLGDDLKLLSDSSVIAFGADGDTTLTHTDGTGLTLNSTNKLCFNDASQYIQGASNAILDIAATDEIELNATLVDINANVEISGTATTTGVHTFSATPVFPDGSLALADLDIDGGTDIGAAIVDADLFIIDDGAGGTNRKTAASRIKTYVGGGVTETDTWRLTTTFAGDAAPISSNLERDDTYGNGLLGTGMTESSGIFTFPSTGYWLVTAYHNITRGDADVAYISLNIQVTTNNSSYNDAAYAYSGAMAGTIEHQSASIPKLIDVTSTTNVKVRFGVSDSESGNTTDTRGSTNENRTCFVFTRLADT